MGRFFAMIIGVALAATLQAQSVEDEIRQLPQRSAGIYFAYPQPTAPLTPSPAGKQPFYISHFGSHGSRYHNGPEVYDAPYKVLAAADSVGKLTELGRDVMNRLHQVRQDADERWGELTPLGAQQQRDVARRMMERFLEVFCNNPDVAARSTSTTRCILSMENALLQIALQHPLFMHQDATQRDMHYLNSQVRRLFSLRLDRKSQACFDAFAQHYTDYSHLTHTLFSDTAYVRQHVDAEDFGNSLFLVACDLQNTELRDDMALFDVFTAEELYHSWKRENAWLYVNNGAATTNKGIKPFSQRNLLRKMIEQADSAMKETMPMVQLRFGEENGIIPLVCLLDIDGYGLATDDLELLEREGWVSYRMAPMGANVQWIFYRSGTDDEDVLLKVLLNEHEAVLPLPADRAPYYRWNDFRDYYLKKLDDYEKR